MPETVLACYEPPALAIGEQIMRRGGNLADVAVATAYAQAVCNPFMTGLMGMASILYHDAERGETHVLDGGHTIGSRARPDQWEDRFITRIGACGSFQIEGDANVKGMSASMTPTFVPTTRRLFERFGSGTLSWAELIEPAARLAEEGFPVYPQFVRYYDPDYGGLGGVRGTLAHRVEGCDTARSILFREGGRPYRNGDRFRQPLLAGTLRRVAREGAEVMTRGELGRKIAEDIEARGGTVSYDDIAGYEPREVSPVRARYRGLEVVATPPPGRGLVLVTALRILEDHDLAALGREDGTFHEVMAHAQALAFEDELRWHGDPTRHDVPVETWLSEEHVEERRREARSRLEGGATAQGTAPAMDTTTTHLTLADDAGNALSFTHSIGGLGAGTATAAAGVLHNNHMCLFDPRPGHVESIDPGMRENRTVQAVVLRDGRPILAVGGAGGTRILTGCLQAIVNVVDFGMQPWQAVQAPRIHCEGWGTVLAEPEVPQAAVEHLRSRGFEVQRDAFLAWIHTAGLHPETGELDAGTDTRATKGRGPVARAGGTGTDT